jgi:hypothetical protein
MDPNCPTHPCLLVIPQTPDSNSNGLIKTPTPEGDRVEEKHLFKASKDLNSTFSQINLNNGDIEKMEKASRNKKSKHMLRIKTKQPEIGFKIESKRKRKERNKNKVFEKPRNTDQTRAHLIIS